MSYGFGPAGQLGSAEFETKRCFCTAPSRTIIKGDDGATTTFQVIYDWDTIVVLGHVVPQCRQAAVYISAESTTQSVSILANGH